MNNSAPNTSQGYKVANQSPLDDKLAFVTIADLKDLGTNNSEAFTYYEGMRVVCIENKKRYEWKEVEQGEVGLLDSNFTYPSGAISFGVNYSGREFNFVEVLQAADIVLPDFSNINENIGDVGIGVYDQFSTFTNKHQFRKIKSDTLSISIENDSIKIEAQDPAADPIYRLAMNGHSIELLLNGSAVDSIPLCDIIEACLLANPQLICNIVAYDCPMPSNLPPDVIGDNSVNSPNRTNYVFTVANFTTGTTPAYNDPESDAMESIRVNTIPSPSNGVLVFNGTTVNVGQIISSSDIALGLFSLVAPDVDEQVSGIFNFSARDTGSLTFSSQNGNMSVTFQESGVIANPIEVGLGDCNIAPTVWDPVYVANPGGFFGNGMTVYSDPAMTIPYNGGGSTYRRRTNGAGTMTSDVFTISNGGIVGDIAICNGSGGGSGGGSGSLFMTSSIPQSNGGGYSGTLDVFNGEPNEVLSCSFNLIYDNDATAEGITFQDPPVDVSSLEPLHTSRTGTITLDSNGNASSNYQVYSGGSHGMACNIQIISRTSSEPVPSSPDNKTTISV